MNVAQKLALTFLMLGSLVAQASPEEGLRSVEDLEKEQAVLGFLGLVSDLATPEAERDRRDRDRWDRDRDRRRPPNGRWDRDRDRWGRDERCRRYGDCYERPGYPGYPGRPRQPRPPHPGYPPPAYGGYYVCYAENLRGFTFSATDYSARAAQDRAMRDCLLNSLRCEPRGCYYY